MTSTAYQHHDFEGNKSIYTVLFRSQTSGWLCDKCTMYNFCWSSSGNLFDWFECVATKVCSGLGPLLSLGISMNACIPLLLFLV